MAYELTRDGFQQAHIAASAVNPNRPVKFAGTSSLHVIPAATSTDRIAGFVKATAGASGLDLGETVTVYEEGNVVKAIAAASIGVNAEVGIASTNGALGVVSAASGVAVWAVGISQSAAAAGEVFSLYVKPRALDAQI